MENNINILKVEPGKPAYTKEVSNTLKALQAEVGGLIEIVELDEGCLLVCNDEGKCLGLPLNRRVGCDIIAGPFFLVSEDGEGNFAALSDEMREKYQKNFAEPEQFTGLELEAEPHMTFYSF